MPKFHFNEAGEPGLCRARKHCPFGNLDEQHFPDEQSARKFYEQQQEFIISYPAMRIWEKYIPKEVMSEVGKREFFSQWEKRFSALRKWEQEHGEITAKSVSEETSLSHLADAPADLWRNFHNELVSGSDVAQLTETPLTEVRHRRFVKFTTPILSKDLETALSEVSEKGLTYVVNDADINIFVPVEKSNQEVEQFLQNSETLKKLIPLKSKLTNVENGDITPWGILLCQQLAGILRPAENPSRR